MLKSEPQETISARQSLIIALSTVTFHPRLSANSGCSQGAPSIPDSGEKFASHATGATDWVGAAKAVVDLRLRIDPQHVEQCGDDVLG